MYGGPHEPPFCAAPPRPPPRPPLHNTQHNTTRGTHRHTSMAEERAQLRKGAGPAVAPGRSYDRARTAFIYNSVTAGQSKRTARSKCITGPSGERQVRDSRMRARTHATLAPTHTHAHRGEEEGARAPLGRSEGGSHACESSCVFAGSVTSASYAHVSSRFARAVCVRRRRLSAVPHWNRHWGCDRPRRRGQPHGAYARTHTLPLRWPWRGPVALGGIPVAGRPSDAPAFVHGAVVYAV